MKLMLAVLFALLLTGCPLAPPASPAEREACYEVARRPYLAAVAKCKLEGRTYAQCEELPAAAAELQRAQEACR